MKIAWLSPFGPTTDIGAFSKCILDTGQALTAGSQDQIDLFCEVNGRAYAFAGRQFDVAEFSADFFRKSYDHIIYNIGNNQENHRFINQMCLTTPGIVVVHDMVMQHYLAWRIFEKIGSPLKYAEMVVNLYGEEGLSIIESSKICSQVRPPIYGPWDSDHVQRLPALELFLGRAKAVIVHSEFARTQIARFTQAPTLRLGLPCDQKPGLSEAEIAAWQTRTRSALRTHFVAFGHITQGKSLHLLLDAFAETPELKRSGRLTIAGFPRDRAYLSELRRLVDLHKLQDIATFELGVSMERLQELKREADVFLNLRYPNTESASGSLVEQLNCAKPVIVLDSGCYAELPDDGGVKLPVGVSAGQIGQAMLGLALDAEKRVAMGARGIAHARAMSSDVYVRRLLDFLRDAAADRGEKASPGRKGRKAAPAPVAEAPVLSVPQILAASIAAGEARPCLVTFLNLPVEQLAFFIQVGVFGLDRAARIEAELIHFIRQVGSLEAYLIVNQVIRLRQFIRRGEGASPAVLLRPRTLELCALLEPRRLAKVFFAVILGRCAGEGEADAYAQQIEAGRPVREVALEIFSSEEFGQRALSTLERAAIRRAVMTIPDRDVPAATALPVVGVGRPVAFSNTETNAQACLIGEWHDAERDGVWSGGAQAAIVFRMAPAGGHDLVVHYSGLDSDKDTREATIRLEGRLADRREHKPDGSVELRFAMADDGTRDVLRLDLDCGRTLRPIDMGLGQDARNLGLFIHSIRLEKALPAAIPAAPPPPSGGAAVPVVSLMGATAAPGKPFIYGERPQIGQIPEGWVAYRRGGIRCIDGRGALTFRVAELADAQLCLRFLLRCVPSGAMNGATYCILRVALDGTVLSDPVVELDSDFELSIDVQPDFRTGSGSFTLELSAAIYDDRAGRETSIAADVILLSWVLDEGERPEAASARAGSLAAIAGD
jgi:glycosyltransferase involved in cell wall biosynthesis